MPAQGPRFQPGSSTIKAEERPASATRRQRFGTLDRPRSATTRRLDRAHCLARTRVGGAAHSSTHSMRTGSPTREYAAESSRESSRESTRESSSDIALGPDRGPVVSPSAGPVIAV